MQDDDDDAGFVTTVPPPHAPPLLAAADTPIPAPLDSAPVRVCLTAVASQEFSSLEYLSMQVGKQKKDCLKFILRRLNIIGISNKGKGVNAEAVDTRMLQLGVTVAEAYTAHKEWASVKDDLKDYTA
jgi:hypothetical protein